MSAERANGIYLLPVYGGYLVNVMVYHGGRKCKRGAVVFPREVAAVVAGLQPPVRRKPVVTLAGRGEGATL
jgi:hypothetical protein